MKSQQLTTHSLYEEPALPDDERKGKSEPYSWLGMMTVPLCLIVWVMLMAKGHRALPYYPFANAALAWLTYRISYICIQLAPLLVALSLLAASQTFGTRRRDWFRQATWFSVGCIGIFGFWTMVHAWAR